MELEVIIGLEIHAQLSTKTKLFCSCDNDAFGVQPNTRVCPVCMGFPGMLPVLNAEALRKGVEGAAALGCTIKPFSKFDRKNYFYPDLPTGYQISQFDQPISEHGEVEIELEGGNKIIGITRVHLENDAGKLTHTVNGTLCDYNRAGTPLVEIVTEPDMRSPEEAQTLAKEIQKILRTVGASTADMEKGMMRFDASISMRPVGDEKLYPRTEIKNLNSFSALLKALKYEVKKQRKAWEAGSPSTQEVTVGWLDDKEETKLLRDKESAMDYRYFPEPDLPPVTFTEKEIKDILARIPELPLAKKHRYINDLKLTDAEALKIAESPELYDFFESAVDKGGEARKIAGLFLSVVLARTDWQKTGITPQHVSDTLILQTEGKISASAAKEILNALMEDSEKTAKEIMEERGLEQKSDSGEIDAWVDQVMKENPEVVADIKAGKDKGIQFLMGQVMKMSRGSANPPLVMQAINKKLNT
ncbi:Asp-tRNA(Asn)/Glu-tRNA(Gln) amidotransferase subunit GatB [bacterium]|nr:Asp-tRNA(Asn)/Glu-tRNA(Gln) amidotransferase subunit GatB [bacterium]NCQ55633.1 Asp-tRNA(Asn)/Glu-tRNA(Gln) amidotransferase subunit GatB [Candidatus Parcubacteria bacterium]NCS67458.1 Asp-tRNA(Asn)/Glu-tRNA(Gln) amidotransferase subunit GatB [Candidatus Peregrinibacteria bacterium]NCS96184.1 Asp-tRNA(Asn)/Glu-tRNA(Gln) amidotransferase subunit GatB [bacterium]